MECFGLFQEFYTQSVSFPIKYKVLVRSRWTFSGDPELSRALDILMLKKIKCQDQGNILRILGVDFSDFHVNLWMWKSPGQFELLLRVFLFTMSVLYI